MALPQAKIDERRASDQSPADATRPDITREFVGAHGPWSSLISSVLSNFFDNLEWIVGLDVYERMSKDPTVSKSLKFQTLSVVSEGIQLHPAITSDKDPDFDKANEIKDFHERSLAGLHRPVTQIIGEMMVALKRGYSVAEVTYNEPTSKGVDAYKLTLKSIKVKPRNSTAFVVDSFRNVLGLTSWLYDARGAVSRTEMTSSQRIIPLEKFAILAFETEDEDPRGINPLRPAYNFWQAKCLVPGLHLKWLEKSGLPSVIGMTPPESETGQKYEGDKTAQEAMADTLIGLESGSVATFASGAKVEKIEVSGTGQQFTRSYLDFDTQIDYALSLQSGATKDSKSGSYAAKRIFKDVLDILIWSRKHAVAQVFQAVLKNGTRYNFGEEYIHLTPEVMVGDEEGRDWARDAVALSGIATYLTDSQWLSLCAELGIPGPDEGEVLPPRTKVAPTAPTDGTGGTGTGTGDAGNQGPGKDNPQEQGQKAA